MRKSKLVAIVVACALLLGLASCSSPSSSSSSSSNCGNGGGQQELKLNNKTHFVSGETLTFNITRDATDSENTFVVFEYFRSAVDLANITTVIVDCAESAGWWKELTAKNEQYVKGLITEINEHENDPEFNTFVKEENRSKLLAFYVSDKTITSETTTSEGSHKNLGKIFVTFYNDNTMDIGIAEPKDYGGYNISGFEGKPYEGDPKAEKGLD